MIKSFFMVHTVAFPVAGCPPVHGSEYSGTRHRIESLSIARVKIGLNKRFIAIYCHKQRSIFVTLGCYECLQSNLKQGGCADQGA